MERAVVNVAFGVDTSARSPSFGLGSLRSFIVMYHGQTAWTILEEVDSSNRSYGERVDKAIVVLQEYCEYRLLIGLLGSHADDPYHSMYTHLAYM